MRSGGNNFNYFPENKLTKFSAVHPLPVPIKISLDVRELRKWSLAFRGGEQLLHLLHTSYATAACHWRIKVLTVGHVIIGLAMYGLLQRDNLKESCISYGC